MVTVTDVSIRAAFALAVTTNVPVEFTLVYLCWQTSETQEKYAHLVKSKNKLLHVGEVRKAQG